jgi:hypothetical protein
MQFHDLIDGTEVWKDAVQAVKDKWPKEMDSSISLEQPTVSVDTDTDEATETLDVPKNTDPTKE